MHFQEYFVRRRCEPRVRRIRFQGIESARPAASVLSAILEADAVIICPSNPFISIGPILAVPGVRNALRETKATVVAIAPIIAGKALKGPAADMLRDLGLEVSARVVAEMYVDLLDLFIVDELDSHSAGSIQALGMRSYVTNTVMSTLDVKRQLARRVLELLTPVEHIGVTDQALRTKK